MTYWVIAKFSDGIYMSADVRVSAPAKSELTTESPMKMYDDISEKLFICEYEDEKKQPIKIGLCTSGFAADEKLEIAEVLGNYFKMLTAAKLSFSNAQEVIAKLGDYINKEYPSHKTQLILKTNYGVGMYIDEKTSIAGWNGKEILSYDKDGYLESAFAPLCLKATQDNFFIPNNIPLVLANQEKINLGKNRPHQDFLGDLIWTAAKAGVIDKNAAQFISAEKADYAVLRPGQQIESKSFLKQLIKDANWKKPTYYGSDTTLFERKNPSLSSIPTTYTRNKNSSTIEFQQRIDKIIKHINDKDVLKEFKQALEEAQTKNDSFLEGVLDMWEYQIIHQVTSAFTN